MHRTHAAAISALLAAVPLASGCLDLSAEGKVFACPGCPDGGGPGSGGSSGSGAGGNGGGGGGLAASSCVCALPPPTCDGNLRLSFVAARCLDDGGCAFRALETQCTNGCQGAQCVGQPCHGVVCAQPPGAVCLNGTTLRTYAAPGACLGGGCSYPSSDVSCSCQGGKCAAISARA